jgi:hypothetical protein
MSQTPSSAPETVSPPAEKKGSPARLIVLLVILGVVFGGLMADLFYMYDAVEAASKRLSEESDRVAQRPVTREGSNHMTRDDVAKAIGFSPSATKVEGGQLYEYYRWWGPIPLSRRSIEVIYADEKGSRFKEHNVANPTMFGGDQDPAPPFEPAPGPGPSGADGEGPGPGPMPPSGDSEPTETPEPTKDSEAKEPDASTPEPAAKEPEAKPAESDSSTADEK